MTIKTEAATSKFLEGFNCAQSVLFSFCDDLQLDKNSALKLSCGFGGGMGRKEEVCGAVSGGIMAIGLKYGKFEKSDKTSMDITYKKTRELMDAFAEKQGTFICRKLLGGCELTTDEGQKQFKELDLRNKVCVPCVQNAVEITEGIL